MFICLFVMYVRTPSKNDADLDLGKISPDLHYLAITSVVDEPILYQPS